MTVEEAVRGYTTWAAWATFNERSGGVIVAGRWADLTVLDRDPFTTPPGRDWLTAGVRYTVVGGQVVHATPAPNVSAR
jgi:predicted amidohydrolase YtcJ